MTTGKALTLVPRKTKAAAPQMGVVPAIVQDGLQDLLVAYPPHAGEDSTDRVRLVRLWAREISDFDPEVTAEALHKLLRNNPRNPFRPSVGDIIAACQSVKAQWTEYIERSHLPDTSNLASRHFCMPRLPEVGEPPASWSARARIGVIRPRLEEMASRYSNTITDSAHAAGPAAVSADQYIGWRLAKDIGPRLAQWPAELLAEFGVLSGPAFARVQGIVDAEEGKRRRARQMQQEYVAVLRAFRERRERLHRGVREAAMARPDVKTAMAARDAKLRSTAAYDTAHEQFVAVLQAALIEEVVARGLGTLLRGAGS